MLCTGPGQWIFGHSTVAAKTMGSSDNTADVDMAAFRKGATIGDAEWAAYDLISIYPTGIAYAFNSGIGTDAIEWEYMLDKDLEPLLTDPSYDIDEFFANRSYFNRILAGELLKGRGTEQGGFYVDLADENVIKSLRYAYTRSIDLWNRNFGIDVTKEPIEIGFGIYEHGGTPVIDENASSIDFPGLFCSRGAGICGEYGGNACYLGLRMGSYVVDQAFNYIAENEQPAFDWAPVDKEYQRLEAIRTHQADHGLTPTQVRHRIQEACSEAMGVIREKDILEAAEAELLRIRDEDFPMQTCGETTKTYNLDWKTAIEKQNLLDCALLSVKAKLFREESRGQYLRPDFPDIDEEHWHCMVVGNLKGDDIVMSKRELTDASWE